MTIKGLFLPKKTECPYTRIMLIESKKKQKRITLAML